MAGRQRAEQTRTFHITAFSVPKPMASINMILYRTLNHFKDVHMPKVVFRTRNHLCSLALLSQADGIYIGPNAACLL